MKRRRIEVGSVRPRQRAHLVIEHHRIERDEILQRSEERAMQDGSEIDLLLRAIRECHCQRVRSDDVETRDPINGMRHALPQWLNL